MHIPYQQMQWPSAMLTLVLVLAQSTSIVLIAMAVKVTLLNAHVAPWSVVPETTMMMLE